MVITLNHTYHLSQVWQQTIDFLFALLSHLLCSQFELIDKEKRVKNGNYEMKFIR